ncbi:unnamed protein product [Cylicostephanus goldi]|uniref:MCM3-like winged helix domain-containing protein n=1 Tax=Cylicostephanus goldi TaxID=71465 RepID=A0A3P6RQ56_CYLGO|nr:unnamed protein product [Cylicostephanus goldi]
MDQSTVTASTRQERSTRRRPRDETTESMDTTVTESQQAAKRPRTETASIDVGRYKLFRSYVRKVFDEIGTTDDMVDLDRVTEGVQSQAGTNQFTAGELEAGYERMASDNAIMIADNKITLI